MGFSYKMTIIVVEVFFYHFLKHIKQDIQFRNNLQLEKGSLIRGRYFWLERVVAGAVAWGPR